MVFQVTHLSYRVPEDKLNEHLTFSFIKHFLRGQKKERIPKEESSHSSTSNI